MPIPFDTKETLMASEHEGGGEMTYTDISDLDLALALHEVKCLPYLAHEVVEYKVLEEDRDLYEGLMDDLADLYYEDEDEEELGEIDWDEIDFAEMEDCYRYAHLATVERLSSSLEVTALLVERWLEEAEEEENE